MPHWVLISGAGSGIGRAIAVKLSHEGYGLVLLGRNEAGLERTRELLADSARSQTLIADVREARVLARKLAQLEGLYAVIANAGIGGENRYGSGDRWQEIVSTNLTGTYRLVNEVLPLLDRGREEGGYRHVLLISSILARLGVPGYSAYCASKAGLLGLMRSWAVEFAPRQILVNAICPGWVDTEMAREGLIAFAQGNDKAFEEVLAEQMADVPLGKMSRPEEIAAFVAFLISPSQTSITGQTLDINNGALMP